jgi:hypothetical protein
MTHKLRISDSLSLPPATVTSTLVTYGGKGMGKTNFGSVLAEELAAARLRFSAIDPMGVWWGLRHSKDGKGKGVECLILGGVHGDIPIEPTGGAVAADLVVDEDVNVIIDISRKPSGETWGVGEKIRFVTEYGSRLFQRQGGLVNGKRREPLFQILDEAARFIPQMIRAGQPELAMCLSVWAQMVEEGRNFGLGVGLFTQRSARLNKDVAELADAMVAFRTVGPNSIDAVMDWMGEHVPKQHIKDLIEKVRALPVGSCLVISPGWLEVEKIVQIRMRETFDSSATPKPGESVKRVTGEAAKPDLAKYAARMQETIERVKANDPKELKLKLAAVVKELEKERLKKPAAAGKALHAAAREVKVADPRAIAQALRKRDGEWAKLISSFRRGLFEAMRRQSNLMLDGFNAAKFEPPVFPAMDESLPPAIPQGVYKIHESNIPPRRKETPRAENNGDLSRPQMAIITALAEAEAIGRPRIGRSWLAFLARVSSKSSGFEKNVSTLRTAGMIDYPEPNMVTLTDKGRGIAPAIDQPMDPTELFHRITSLVSAPQAELLKVLRTVYPKALAREDLADRASVSHLSSGFEKNVSTLSSRELVHYPQQGMVKLQDWVMLEEQAA